MMKIKKMKLDLFQRFQAKFLTLCISALSTGLVLSSVAQASDIDVYQEAKSGDITLMFTLDISGSMSRYYSTTRGYGCDLPSRVSDLGRYSAIETPVVGGPSYLRQWCLGGDNNKYYDRITRLKDGMMDLLYGNPTKKIERLSDDKILGLSTLGASSGVGTSGAVLVPARRLSDVYNGKTQRQIMIDSIVSLNATTVTPTARSYGEVVAYLMGETSVRSGYSATNDVDNKGYNVSGYQFSAPATKNGNKYISPPSLSQQDGVKKCSGQGVYVLTDGDPNYNDPTQGLMRSALGNYGSNFTCSDGGGDGSTAWDCTLKLSMAILDPTKNPKNLKFKTAVVGFGGSFNSIPSYNASLTQQQNLDNINNSSASANQKQAARWGVLAEGGWYAGSSSQDVVDSVNGFINSLSTEIPAVTTGSPTIARDALNPSVLQKEAYYPQFQPTPDKSYQLWSGNLKKYNVVLGVLKDKSGNSITDSQGRIIDNYDLWARAVNDAVKDADEDTVGSIKFALVGGAKSQLELRTTTNTDNRKLLTNRIINGTGSSATFVNSTTLRQVKSTDLTDTNYKNDMNRGYLISLLGYNVDASNPNGINLTTAAELRQVGAVMHSSPLLLTNKGTITYTDNVLGSKDREDYVLFGTTQGLLHVVDAKTGKEKFAFVPNEMVESQKQAFLDYETTSGGTGNLFYGVDGPWTTYTEYVVDSSGALTVGTGVDSQQGTQLAYGGLRMGGRSYYALDLTNVNDPKLKFQISPADRKVFYNGSSRDFDQLQYMGQSWSKPTIAWVKWGKSRKRVMFVGGGYDAGGDDGDARTGGVKGAYAGYESDSYNQTNKKGGGVYMFDADNGDLLWWASANASATSSVTADSGVMSTKDDNLKYSVVSEIRAEDRNSDGLVDHLYFGDLGGQLFRIDLDNTATKLGAFAKAPKMLLNLQGTNGASPRFYEMPAFSVYDHAGNTFAVISIGSGNRSAPLVDYTVGTTGRDYDAVYNIYDKDVTARDLFKTTYTPKLTTALTLSSLGEVTQANRNDSTTLVAPYTRNGWYFKFRSQKPQSAKVFATPVVLNSRMFVTTFDGSKDGLSGDCGAGIKGESFMNQFCMPFGQCVKAAGGSGSGDPECSSGDGCSVGPGIQVPPIVDDKSKCDPATDPKQCKEIPKPNDGTNNKNYCISTGNRGAAVKNGIVSTGSSHICLVPQRWFEYSSR